MEVHDQKDQRHVDRGQTVREPARQEDVRDRTIVRTERLGHITLSPPTTAAASAARRSDRFAKPAYTG